MFNWEPGTLFRHFKGGYYKLVGLSVDSNTGVVCAVLQPIKAAPGRENDTFYEGVQFCHRPTSEVLEDVDKPEYNYKGPRFQPIAVHSAEDAVVVTPDGVEHGR